MNKLYDQNNIILYNDDCIDIMKNIQNESIDLICTDPPYLCTSRGGSGNMGGYWTQNIAKKGKIFQNNNISCKQYLPEFFRILKNGTHCYIMTNNINLIQMLNEALNAGFKFIKSLIWNKGNMICGRYYMNCFEYILMFRKGEARDINNCSTPDILNVPIYKLKNDKGNLHNTQKPVQLMKILIENSSNENELIFEPFAGAGSTLIASKLLNRKCIGCEIDKNYSDIIINRLNNKTINNIYNNQTLLF